MAASKKRTERKDRKKKEKLSKPSAHSTKSGATTNAHCGAAETLGRGVWPRFGLRVKTQRPTQLGLVELAFPSRNHECRHRVANEIGDRAAFTHKAIDAEDERHARHRNAWYDR